jgi:hypothetical protein
LADLTSRIQEAFASILLRESCYTACEFSLFSSAPTGKFLSSNAACFQTVSYSTFIRHKRCSALTLARDVTHGMDKHVRQENALSGGLTKGSLLQGSEWIPNPRLSLTAVSDKGPSKYSTVQSEQMKADTETRNASCTRQRPCLRHCVTNNKTAGSIPQFAINVILPAALWSWGRPGL